MAWDAEGLVRDDGVELKKHPDGTWMVFKPAGPNDAQGSVISYCPCCLKPMATIRNARLVADVVWPEKEKVDGTDSLGGDAA